MSQNINVNQVENPLNKNAKEYVPTKFRNKERKMFDPNFIQFIICLIRYLFKKILLKFN